MTEARAIPVMERALPLAIALAALSSCAPNIVPDAGHRPTAMPAPVPAPPAASASVDWLDWPLTAGTWTYARTAGSTIARFGTGGAVQAWVRCDLANRAIAVGRVARAREPMGMMTVRTTFGTVEWPAREVGGATPGTEAIRGASDPGLDQIAFSRGRFALMLRDQPPVVAPSWAEPVRVVEDCRG